MALCAVLGSLADDGSTIDCEGDVDAEKNVTTLWPCIEGIIAEEIPHYYSIFWQNVAKS